MGIKETKEKLIYRYNDIETNIYKLKEHFQCNSIKNELIDNITKSIAFYLHELKSNQETVKIYQELLEYKSDMKASVEYRKKITEALKCINVAGDFFSQLPNFEEKCTIIDEKIMAWSSPFSEGFLKTDTKNLILHMRDIESIDNWGYEKINHLLNVICGDAQGMNGIIPYWEGIISFDITILKKALDELEGISQFLKHQEEYEYHYSGARAAENLNKYYLAYTPMPIHPPELTFDDRIFLSFIRLSLPQMNWQYLENIFTDCRELHQTILAQLTAKEECYIMSIPTEIKAGVDKFREDYSEDTKTAFIIMQFKDTTPHKAIVSTIKDVLKKHNIIALRADDKEYTEDLFSNIKVYIHSCDFGIAVFDRITEDDFNPNVSLEVGYMLGMGKSVMLLKDQTLKSLPTDLVGKLYKPFDAYSIENSMPSHIEKWLADRGIISE